MKQRIRLSPALVIICGLAIAGSGCHSTNPQGPNPSVFSTAIPVGTSAGLEERDSLLAAVARLRMAAEESLDAAVMIGTPASQLAEARTALERSERYVQEGEGVASDAQESLQPLRAAVDALRQAEEAAVYAGLRHIESELAAGYAQVLTPQFVEKRQSLAMVRVNQGVTYLYGGAGLDFEVVGKARAGDMLNLMAERGDWYRVRTQGGLEGWIAKDRATRAVSRGL